MALPEDIVSKVRQDFSEDDSLLVLQELRDLSEKDPRKFNGQVLRCLVFLARGKIENIDRWAREDWRELIVQAQYEWVGGDLVRLFEFPFGFHPDIETIKGWFVGQQILVPWAEGRAWTVEKPDIQRFWLQGIRSLNDVIEGSRYPNQYFVRTGFVLVRGEKDLTTADGIEGEVVFRYKSQPETGGFEFIKSYCDYKKFNKRGNW